MMRRMHFRLVLSLSGVLLAGCAGSPWSSHKQGETRPVPAQTASAGTAAANSAPAGTAAQAGQTDAQAMQQVMAELEQLGAIDPAAQEKLLADLRQTEPSLWPRVITAFRAAAAYRRQQQREGDASVGSQRGPAAGNTDSAAASVEPAPAGSGSAKGLTASTVGRGQTAAPAPQSGAGNRSGLAAEGGAAAPDILPPPGVVRRMPPPGAVPGVAEGQVVPAGYEAAVPGDWRGQLAAATRAMEAEAKGAPKGENELALEARLRMLYLLAGRREDALRPIAEAPAPLQDFWVKQLYGLSVWLDAERTPDAARRAAQTKQALDEAVVRLAEASPLLVRNLAFYTKVENYGTIKPFSKAEFSPDEEVVLYAEVENFTVESTPKGFHTALKTHYQILDGRGQRVEDHEFAPMEETCQNCRRDFFITHRLRIPKRVYPGKHVLQLTVEDLKSHKVGQSTIDFVVKGDDKEPRG